MTSKPDPIPYASTDILPRTHRIQMRSYNRFVIAAAFAPLIMLFLDLPAILLGVDRMNEIDRVTPVTLWISLGSGLIAGGSLVWLVLFKSKNESLKPKQWAAIVAWGPLSALFVGWSINWVATIVPGETRVIQATVQSFQIGGRSLCARQITLLRLGHTDSDQVCLTGGMGRRVGPDDLSVGEKTLLTIHTTSVGSTVESIEHGERP
jgi:hypothetical protein